MGRHVASWWRPPYCKARWNASSKAFRMRAGVHISLHFSIPCGSFTLLQTASQLAVTSAASASYFFMHPSSQDLVAGEPRPCCSLHFNEHWEFSIDTVLKRWLRAQDSLQAGSLSFLSRHNFLQVSSCTFFASAVFLPAAAPPMSVRTNTKRTTTVFIFLVMDVFAIGIGDDGRGWQLCL